MSVKGLIDDMNFITLRNIQILIVILVYIIYFMLFYMSFLCRQISSAEPSNAIRDHKTEDLPPQITILNTVILF